MARIFISYSRTDEDFARHLAEALSNMGADVWIDIEDIPAGDELEQRHPAGPGQR
ncbi:MAG: toll/interleukin-1 receptor domain-containing protein [Anaerolineae bacterium]|nr:toll/interleukin-1 receptor domain-containing protein [Anaerolineae bacterium]